MAVTFNIKKQLSNDDNVADNLNSLQDDILAITRQLNLLVSVQMVLLTNIALTTTAAPIAHNLGYECRGFIVVNKTASFDVYRSDTATNPDARKYVMLRTSSGSQTVSLLVF